LIANLHIRKANTADLVSIVAIYNQAINAGGATADISAFSVDERREWFTQFNNDYPIYVAENNEQVIGYCYLSPYRKGREALKKVAEISFYIDYDFHGKGVGSALLQHAIKSANHHHFLAILLDTNQASIRLLKKFGFTQWGHFPNIAQFGNNTCGQVIYGLTL